MSTSTLYIDNIYNKAGTGGPNFSNGITTTGVNGGQLGGMRNAIINGNFDVWQRGTSFAPSTSAIYTADRWFRQNSGGTVGTSRQEFALGQTDVPNNPKYFLRHEVTVGDDAIRLVQRIEGVDTFSGQTITVSYWARHVSGTLPSGGIKAQLRQEFGTGGSPSSTVYVNSDNISLTSDWQKFTVTFNVPSISGKTIGTDGNDYLGIALLWQVGTDTSAYTIDLAQVQLEVGSTATPFEHRPYGVEQHLCERYYEIVHDNYGEGHRPLTAAWTTADSNCFIPFRTRKRATTSNVTYTGTMQLFNGGWGDVTSVTLLGNAGHTGLTLNVNRSGALVARSVYFIRNGKITVDAEL